MQKPALPASSWRAESCQQRLEERFYLEPGSRIVFPSAADRRAASRISVTVTLVGRDDRSSSFVPPITTARRYESSSSYGRGSGWAESCCSFSLTVGRTRMPSLFTVITYPVSPYTSRSLRSTAQFHDAWMIACALG